MNDRDLTEKLDDSSKIAKLRSEGAKRYTKEGNCKYSLDPKGYCQNKNYTHREG